MENIINKQYVYPWLILLAAFIAGQINLNAARRVWVGNTGSWSTPGNWTSQTVPTLEDEATVSAGKAQLTGTATVNTFIFGNATLHGGTLNVTGKGFITDSRLDGNTLIFHDNSTISSDGLGITELIKGSKVINRGQFSIFAESEFILNDGSEIINESHNGIFSDQSGVLLLQLSFEEFRDDRFTIKSATPDSPGIFRNRSGGTFIVDAPSGTNVMDVAVMNSGGKIEIKNGTLMLNNGIKTSEFSHITVSTNEGARIVFNENSRGNTIHRFGEENASQNTTTFVGKLLDPEKPERSPLVWQGGSFLFNTPVIPSNMIRSSSLGDATEFESLYVLTRSAGFHGKGLVEINSMIVSPSERGHVEISKELFLMSHKLQVENADIDVKGRLLMHGGNRFEDNVNLVVQKEASLLLVSGGSTSGKSSSKIINHGELRVASVSFLNSTPSFHRTGVFYQQKSTGVLRTEENTSITFSEGGNLQGQFRLADRSIFQLKNKQSDYQLHGDIFGAGEFSVDTAQVKITGILDLKNRKSRFDSSSFDFESDEFRIGVIPDLGSLRRTPKNGPVGKL
jgi:hypothetical protein